MVWMATTLKLLENGRDLKNWLHMYYNWNFWVIRGSNFPSPVYAIFWEAVKHLSHLNFKVQFSLFDGLQRIEAF